jgi:hypothetical protein
MGAWVSEPKHAHTDDADEFDKFDVKKIDPTKDTRNNVSKWTTQETNHTSTISCAPAADSCSGHHVPKDKCPGSASKARLYGNDSIYQPGTRRSLIQLMPVTVDNLQQRTT